MFEKGEENMEYEMALKTFQETGRCLKHQFIKSKPFKTSEGIFSVISCKICKLAEIEYKGKVYQDTLSNILNFVINKGILNEQKLKPIETIDLFGEKDDQIEEIVF